jgi:hypothetical protein
MGAHELTLGGVAARVIAIKIGTIHLWPPG